MTTSSSIFFLGKDDIYSKENESDALKFVNTWNYDHRYPVALADYDSCSIIANGNLMCTEDVTDDMIGEFVEDMVFGTKQLFTALSDAGYSYYEGMK